MLRKCEKCGRFFGDEGDSKICTACALSTRHFKSTGDPEHDKFQATRDVVYDNPDISPQGIIDILAEMGIEITARQILKYVDEGRLTLNTEKIGNHCQMCGTKIGFGKYCDRCRLKKELESVDRSDTQDVDYNGKIRMHIKK